MRTTTYVASSVEAAMIRARAELGDDALLVQTRQGKSGYEVTFALEGPEESAPAPRTAPAATAPQASQGGDFQEISRQLDEIRRALARTAQATPAAMRRIPELSNLQARLIAAEVDPVLAKDIIDRVEASLAVEGVCQRADLQTKSRASVRMLLNFDFAYMEALMHAELKRRVRIDASIGRKLAVFVGPTGAGKTTSMVKLAMGAGGCVRLMSLDSTPGAREEMKLYASTCGLDFVPLLAAAKLPKILQSLKDADLIMLDTPGFTGPDSAEAAELAAALAQCPDAEVFLVVPGYMKGGDLQRAIQRYEKFRFTKILVTKLDETGALGSLFSEVSRCGANLSFFTDGTRIPEDIRAATPDEVLDRILAGLAHEEQSAA